MKEALLYQTLKNQKVQCQTCAHYCLIPPNKRGRCGVRENRKGKLYSLVYGRTASLHLDPIEKKPLYHFLPGTFSLSVATAGCQFACKNCQNWEISQTPKINGKISGEKISPAQIVKKAQQYGAPSISYTYTDPTVFLEYALDTMKLAIKEGLKNIWVTAGFMSPQALELISPYLDAANVDLKSFDDDFYRQNCDGRLQPVLENLKTMKKNKIWLEVTTLIIPGLNDQKKNLKEIAFFIKKELGAETPWHISRFFPEVSWQLQNLPVTPRETLETAFRIGREVGLKYIYQGNV